MEIVPSTRNRCVYSHIRATDPRPPHSLWRVTVLSILFNNFNIILFFIHSSLDSEPTEIAFIVALWLTDFYKRKIYKICETYR